MFLPYFISVSGSSCTCRNARGAVAPAFWGQGWWVRGGNWGEEPPPAPPGLASPSSPEDGRMGGNLWSLCEYGKGGFPPSVGRGADKVCESAPRPWGGSLLYLFSHHSGVNRPREGGPVTHVCKTTHMHVHAPFRAQPDLTPRPSPSQSLCPGGSWAGREGGHATLSYRRAV